MTREIKFRTFIGDRMRAVDQLDFRLHEGLVIAHTDDMVIPNAKLMQCTGLLDKNGKDIYEGDVLRMYGGHLATVEWEGDGTWMIGFIASRFYHSEAEYMDTADVKTMRKEWGRAEVIGDIYQNPELLKPAS